MARDAMRIEGFARRTVSAPTSRTDPTGEPAVGPGTSQTTRDALTSVVRTLFDMGMPSHEIGAVVGADQPILVHRYLVLHGERLAERLAGQLQILARIEQTLTRAMLDHTRACESRGLSNSRPPARSESNEGRIAISVPASDARPDRQRLPWLR